MNAVSTIPSLHERLLQHVGDGAAIVDASGVIRWSNRAFDDLVGVSSEAPNVSLSKWLVNPTAVEALLAEYDGAKDRPRSAVAKAISTETDLLFLAYPGLPGESCMLIVRPFQDAVSSFDRTISFATRDGVTQLLNREAFEEILSTSVAAGGNMLVVCASVDQFSTINDVYGHAEGDSLLRVVARRLRDCVDPKAVISRLYGGRFALLLSVEDESQLQHASANKVSKLHHAFTIPVTVAGGEHTISLSIGIAIAPRDANTGPELLSAAETAIRAASNDGSGKTSWFQPKMLSERRRALEIESDLRRAIVNNELMLHYQPKVRRIDNTIVGFEALVRWNHPTKGFMSPAEFIPVAEQCDLIADLGTWVVRETCRQLAQWRSDGLNILPVAVNVSPNQILTRSIDGLLAPLAEFGLPPNCIEIEITESAMMDRLTAAPAVIASLRRAGVQISIDDFGTGHSSLSNLRRLPIHTLKIDRSFVEDIEESREAHDIVATIIAMANTLSLEIVAEGVETESQANMLQLLGAEIMQGYLFARPMPGAKAGQLLSATSPD